MNTLPEQARELRKTRGWGYKRIATALGVSRDTAREWVRLDRTRRRNYRTCADCGTRYRKEIVHICPTAAAANATLRA